MIEYTPRKWIYVDVDGTLIVNGEYNQELISAIAEWHSNGFSIVVWSARGEQYAAQHALDSGVSKYCHSVLCKPYYVVDDRYLDWIENIQILNENVGLVGSSGPVARSKVRRAKYL